MSQRSISQLFINPLGPRYKNVFATLSLTAAVALASSSAIAQQPEHAHQTDPSAQHGLEAAAATPAAQRKAAIDSTEAFISAHKQWAQARGASNKAVALQSLIAKAEARREMLAELIQSNPAEALRVAIPEEKQTGMPAEVQEMLEQKLDLDGELEVVIEDYEDGSHKLRQFLKTPAGERFELHVASQAKSALSGQQVELNGLLLEDQDDIAGTDGQIAVGSSDDILIMGATGGDNGGSPGPLPNTFGERKVAVIMVNFQDQPADKPWTKTQVNNFVFGQVNNYFQENSYNQTWLSGNTFGWYTLPMNGGNCPSGITDAADQMAANAGVNLSAYSHIVYMLAPSSGCNVNFGTLGGTPTRATIISGLSQDIVTHELGHNFGLYHGHSLNCTGGVLSTNCSESEYGDNFDVMGQGSGHLSAFQKQRLGWLAYNQSPPITTVATGGTYTISTLATDSSQPKALKVLNGTDSTTGQSSWFYLEYRQPTGFDSAIFDWSDPYSYPDNLQNGVIVHKAVQEDGNSSLLLDMTPDSTRYASHDLRDPALEVGQSYNDPDTGVTITPLSNDANGITVDISYKGGSTPTCTRTNPTISLTSGQSDWVAAGTAVSYSITVTNNDSSACNNSSYNLTNNKPTGWSSSFGSSTLTLTPGASATTNLTVTSSTDATDGFYNIDVSATSGSYSTSGSVTYIVDNPVGNSAPVAVNDSASTTYNTVVTIPVLNNDSDPDGDTLHISSVSGVNGNAQINGSNIIFTPASGFSGTETFNYSVSDGNGGSASASVSVSVAAPISTNQAPVAVNDNVTLTTVTTVTIPVLNNDEDPEGDTIRVVGTVGGNKGTISVNSDGTITYTPGKRFKNGDSFSYTISDGEKSASATVSLLLQQSSGDTGSKGGGKGNGRKN
ncbi:MAG: Ig-like domain-containing protein [Amphritea sp.]